MATEISGTRRPGGRTERTRLAALNATLELLGERGYAELTVEAVAERSGVHKTTLYRRWESAEGLVAAALLMGTEQEWTAPDTGSLEGDLRGINLELVHYFTSPGERELPTASISAAFLSTRAADALREFYVDRHARSAVVVDRAVERGEVPAGTDAGRGRAGGVRADLLPPVRLPRRRDARRTPESPPRRPPPPRKPACSRQRTTEPPLSSVTALVDRLGLGGAVGHPALPDVEGLRPLVRREHPQDGAVPGQLFDDPVVQRPAEAPPPVLRQHVQRVQLPGP